MMSVTFTICRIWFFKNRFTDSLGGQPREFWVGQGNQHGIKYFLKYFYSSSQKWMLPSPPRKWLWFVCSIFPTVSAKYPGLSPNEQISRRLGEGERRRIPIRYCIFYVSTKERTADAILKAKLFGGGWEEKSELSWHWWSPWCTVSSSFLFPRM